MLSGFCSLMVSFVLRLPPGPGHYPSDTQGSVSEGVHREAGSAVQPVTDELEREGGQSAFQFTCSGDIDSS